ncbi:MAG: hypothetical protein VST71_04700 [Nitrospirota bacterium]|nr:hypothetical protein [Nitrospirota bacterium]
MKTFKNSLILQANASIFFILFILTIPVTASSYCNPAGIQTVSLIAPVEILENSVTGTTIDDVIQLLGQGFSNLDISLNNRDADIQIILNSINPDSQAGSSRFIRGRKYDYLRYPDHEYQWDSSCRDGTIILRLSSPSFEGMSFGLYGLLQEKLGFKFYHPKRTIIPHHQNWPLPVGFQWKAFPRFDKKGFHIHSLHPIELSRQLHDPDYPDALPDIKEYIDWLARNQQNLFQFFLLRDIDRKLWIAHAAEFVDYAHKRGILTGVEISLSMLQQKAFQTIKLLKFFPSYRKQIDDTLAWLFKAPWDFVTVDFTMGEYLPDLATVMPETKEYMVKQVTEKYNRKLMFTTHVISKKANPFSSKKAQKKRETEPVGKTGILIHTVMFYSIDEPVAPVYGNKNQRFMLRKAIGENKRQEVWYWPESAYWVTFDNSVPLFLLPYLDARWSDMVTMKRIGVDNHLTFSSGWEWGYWLTDWSIARWSWKYTEDGIVKKTHPLSILWDIFPDHDLQQSWKEALQLQKYYLKQLGLISFLAALDPSAEFPRPFNKPFQPRPPFAYKWLLVKASYAETARVLNGPVNSLNEYARKMNLITDKIEIQTSSFIKRTRDASPELKVIAGELTRGLKVTALRARHKALLLKTLIAMRKGDKNNKNLPNKAGYLLKEAEAVRLRAQKLVLKQEQIYRYPVGLIARQRKSFTAYEFGYLYPVSNLYFWKREEDQIKHRRFDALYMSIWDYPRIIGIDSLCR